MPAIKVSDEEWQRLLEEQVQGHGRLYFRIAVRLLRDAEQADDVCQQAFLKAWAERQKINRPERLRAWLLRTVVNQSLLILRRRRVEQRVLARTPAPADIPSPADAAADAESVTAALAQLPESVRVVVVLRVMQGLSGNEVKDLLGMSAAGVSRALHHGLDQLRSSMATECDGG